eukprot:TRINITY_DN19463_c0_g1_i1.p1 TRINITY_DN19463_c0_g1~~TRINITY_DN19463_c0_g1_i1.p1  ORF type:complete len:429 (-),score=93.73 TRINITY_DN19463_c0_g1_i1:18-1304(-)
MLEKLSVTCLKEGLRRVWPDVSLSSVVERHQLHLKFHEVREHYKANYLKELKTVQDEMDKFSLDSGIERPSPQHPRRYLWTDAFAVCNFWSLYELTHNQTNMASALQLIQRVHYTLGKYRPDDPRKGWLNKLPEDQGDQHPTLGGLRIGKPLPENLDAGEGEDEWDRDGQYYHYLTRWAHALLQTGKQTGDTNYLRYAHELVLGVHTKFVYQPKDSSKKRMYWKMSTDLSKPLVKSMGHHDPLDGLLTYKHIQMAFPEGNLGGEVQDMEEMCKGRDWSTEDPLGLGGLLIDVYRAYQIYAHSKSKSDYLLMKKILVDSLDGLKLFSVENHLDYPAKYRLAFREFGLSIGLSAVIEMWFVILESKEDIDMEIITLLQETLRYKPLKDKIDLFWAVPANQLCATWKDHQDINRVMWCTSLIPQLFLNIKV